MSPLVTETRAALARLTSVDDVRALITGMAETIDQRDAQIRELLLNHVDLHRIMGDVSGNHVAALILGRLKMEEAMIAAGPLEASVRALTPTKGLTFRKGKREANVHEVNDGIVFYGVYLDGDDWPAGLYQATLDEWNRLATQAVENGAEVFTMVRPNESGKGLATTGSDKGETA